GDAKAGVAQIGNEIVACRFFGGRHAVTTGRTSAGWQALLMDCAFAGQAEAAIETSSAGLTVIGCRFRDAPCGIVVPGGRIERLYVRDSRFERIPSAAILVDRTEKPSNQINLDSVTCAAVPHLLRFRDGEGGVDAAGELYAVRRLSHGLHVEGACSRTARTWHGTSSDCRKLEALPAMPESDIPPLPPQDRWVSVVACGAKGDGRTDDTQAFRKAVASGPAVYVPSGRYLLSDTIELRPNTALIGLHPRAAMLTVKAQTPGFADANTPKPLIVAPKGGGNIICGLGFAPGRNPGAIVVKWSAGERSCVDDVFFMYGGGPSGEGLCYGLWVAGGGGVFKNIWAPNGQARNGLYVSETNTEGKIILVSVEHHTTTEVRLDRVRNWAFDALQTETEGGLGETCTAVEMAGCEDITFSNLFLYRTSRTKRPHPHGVRLAGCRDIAFRGVHNFSLSRVPYTTTLFDADANTGVPQREAACVTVRPPASAGAAGGE
ncbi:MAG: glycosyl hydrolase family 28-related protein, partial [Phycisphaerae bacterium]